VGIKKMIIVLSVKEIIKIAGFLIGIFIGMLVYDIIETFFNRK